MSYTPEEYAFFPTPEQPLYGLLFVVDEEGRHFTARGEPGIVQEFKGGPIPAGFTMPGSWEVIAGWPDDEDSPAWHEFRRMYAELS